MPSRSHSTPRARLCHQGPVIVWFATRNRHPGGTTRPRSSRYTLVAQPPWVRCAFGAPLVIDGTSVGIPVVDMFRKAAVASNVKLYRGVQLLAKHIDVAVDGTRADLQLLRQSLVQFVSVLSVPRSGGEGQRCSQSSMRFRHGLRSIARSFVS